MGNEIQVIVKMPVGTTGQYFEYEAQGQGGMYNLTDLWQRFGSIENKEPKQWKRKAGKKFIEHFCEQSKVPVGHVWKTTRGNGGATWAHWQIAMSYMSYLSPDAQMKVNQIVKERIEEEANPGRAIDRGIDSYKKMGYSTEWIMDRISGKAVRQDFTDELKRRGVTGFGYADCTNRIYRKVLGGDKTEIKRRLKLGENDRTRDHLNRLQLQATSFAEICAITKMEHIDAHDNDTAGTACDLAGKVTDEAIRKLTGASCHVQPKALTGF